MPSPDSRPAAPGGGTRPAPDAPAGAARTGAYTLVVLAVGALAALYGLRTHGIFACGASGYGADGYLAYCQSRNYGDYDHGAFWFDLEPDAIEAAARAEAVFIGNSRLQIGLSSKALDQWFRAAKLSYYLMGFAYDANHTFEGPLIAKIRPQAGVYVINLDLFFEPETAPIRAVLHDPTAKARYSQKQKWQQVHQRLCTWLPLACGNEISFSRSRSTGTWIVAGEAEFPSGPVSYDEAVDQATLEKYAALGRTFLASLPVPRECAVLTNVPTMNSRVGTAKAVADALGLPLIAPELTDLQTFDRSHLDGQSAERWSAAFLEAAGPRIRACVDGRAADPRPGSAGADAEGPRAEGAGAAPAVEGGASAGPAARTRG